MEVNGQPVHCQVGSTTVYFVQHVSSCCLWLHLVHLMVLFNAIILNKISLLTLFIIVCFLTVYYEATLHMYMATVFM